MKAQQLALGTPSELISGAQFSACRRYRYRLWRAWGDPTRRVAWVMINPSTADETELDQTIRKCIGFAAHWEFGAIDVANLFAWRATDVRELGTAADPVGPDNDAAIARVCAGADRVVLAWGASAKFRGIVEMARVVTEIVRQHARGEVGTLGPLLGDSSPRHPLMPAYATPFVPLTVSP